MPKSRPIRKRPESAGTTGVGTPRRNDRMPRVLVTAGPTHEPIDGVRFIGNRSSGAMGIALAEALAGLGAPCTLLLGPTSLTSHHSSIRVQRFRTTADLQRLLEAEFPHCDVLVMAAAVADYRPLPLPGQRPGKGKLPRQKKGLTLRLESTPDLVAGLAALRSPGQTVVGFALEPQATMHKRAAAKLVRKGLDLIVANPLETMESPNIRASVLSAEGVALEQSTPVSKRVFARKLARLVLRWHRAATLN